ncbi:Endothelial cell-specific molecule 1 [Apodemus speciosus]|uniref:Endothelial cell-specific molecule 1 n=1 Tax=Apodemus speciosus TaxID=105296 RepID=A0ABQ0FH96_APOSI
MTGKHAGNTVYKTHKRVGRSSATTLDGCFPASKDHDDGRELSRSQLRVMKSLLLLTTLLVPLHLGMAWSAKYAVDCPEHCDKTECRSSLRCKRTVLDDCGCCQVCAAGPGETCYRTVSGMDGVKCGPGLKCHFYSEEDDFGDEFGICKDCPYGTFGMECKKRLAIASRAYVTGRTSASHTERDAASGDGNAVREEVGEGNAAQPSVMKWLNPR